MISQYTDYRIASASSKSEGNLAAIASSLPTLRRRNQYSFISSRHIPATGYRNQLLGLCGGNGAEASRRSPKYYPCHPKKPGKSPPHFCYSTATAACGPLRSRDSERKMSMSFARDPPPPEEPVCWFGPSGKRSRHPPMYPRRVVPNPIPSAHFF